MVPGMKFLHQMGADVIGFDKIPVNLFLIVRPKVQRVAEVYKATIAKLILKKNINLLDSAIEVAAAMGIEILSNYNIDLQKQEPTILKLVIFNTRDQ